MLGTLRDPQANGNDSLQYYKIFIRERERKREALWICENENRLLFSCDQCDFSFIPPPIQIFLSQAESSEFLHHTCMISGLTYSTCRCIHTCILCAVSACACVYFRLLKHGDECFEPQACPCLWKGKEYFPGDRVSSPCHQW